MLERFIPRHKQDPIGSFLNPSQSIKGSFYCDLKYCRSTCFPFPIGIGKRCFLQRKTTATVLSEGRARKVRRLSVDENWGDFGLGSSLAKCDSTGKTVTRAFLLFLSFFCPSWFGGSFATLDGISLLPKCASLHGLCHRPCPPPGLRSQIDSLFVYGTYDPEVDNAFDAEPGLGSKGFEFTNCKVRASKWPRI